MLVKLDKQLYRLPIFNLQCGKNTVLIPSCALWASFDAKKRLLLFLNQAMLYTVS